MPDTPYIEDLLVRMRHSLTVTLPQEIADLHGEAPALLAVHSQLAEAAGVIGAALTPLDDESSVDPHPIWPLAESIAESVRGLAARLDLSGADLAQVAACYAMVGTDTRGQIPHLWPIKLYGPTAPTRETFPCGALPIAIGHLLAAYDSERASDFAPDADPELDTFFAAETGSGDTAAAMPAGEADHA